MIDYNSFLSDKEKISLLQEKIEIEKSKMTKCMQENDSMDVRLGILEDYYSALKVINQKYCETLEAVSHNDGNR